MNTLTAPAIAPNIAPAPPDPVIDGIVQAVGQYYDLTPEDLLGKERRDAEATDARAIMLALIADHTELKHEEIGEIVGGRSQATVNAIIRHVRNQAENDPKLQAHLEELSRAAAGEPLEATVATWPELVTQHYGLSRDEIATPKSRRAMDARQVMAHLLVEKTVLKGAVIARKTGFSTTERVQEGVRQVAERREEDERFAQELEQLESMSLPETLKAEDVIERVLACYGLERDELISDSTREHHVRPRLMAVHLLVRELGYSQREAALVLGYPSKARGQLVEFEEKMKANVGLQRQRDDILSASVPEMEPLRQRVMKVVCDFYGVEPEELADDEHFLDTFQRPREVIAYLLTEKFGLSIHEAQEQIRTGDTAVRQGRQRVRQEIEHNPLLAAEIDYLQQAKRIKIPLNDRIMMRVSEATGINVEDIINATDDEALHARQIAIFLMAERGHLGTKNILEYFGLTTEQMFYRAKTVIEHEQPRSSLLRQQIGWVRKRIFSERPAEFKHNPNEPDLLPEVLEQEAAGGLPHIDEKLVHPEIRKQVYGIIEQVADFYDIPATEIIGREKEFMVNRARRAAVMLCRQARIPQTEVSICFGLRYEAFYARTVEAAEEDARDHPVFAEELEALTNGEPRRDVMAETLSSIMRYYGVRGTEIREGEGPWPNRARAVFLAVMTELACTSREQLAEVVGKSKKTTDALIVNTQKRLERDARLKAEVDYLLRPGEAPRPPDAKDVLRSVSQTFDVSAEQLMHPESPEERRTRRVAMYLLADEVCLPYKDIAKLFDDTSKTVLWHVKRARIEMERNPRHILEIDTARPAHSVGYSTAGKILRYVANRYKIQPRDISSQDNTPELGRARRVAIGLMLQSGEYTVEQTAAMLDMSVDDVESMQPQQSASVS